MQWEIRGTSVKTGAPGRWKVEANTRDEAIAQAAARGITNCQAFPAKPPSIATNAPASPQAQVVTQTLDARRPSLVPPPPPPPRRNPAISLPRGNAGGGIWANPLHRALIAGGAALALVIVVIAAIVHHHRPAGEANSPAQSSSGGLAMPDYYTLLLQPRMWEDLNLSAPARVNMTGLGRGATTVFYPGNSIIAPEQTPADLEKVLRFRGHEVLESLTVEDDRRFCKLFSELGCMHVYVEGPAKGPPSAFTVRFTRYKGEDANVYWKAKDQERRQKPSPWENADDWYNCGSADELAQIRTAAEALQCVDCPLRDVQQNGYDWLMRAIVTPADQSAVMDHLRKFLPPLPAEGHERGIAIDRIRLYCRWGDQSTLPTLMRLLQDPDKTSGYQEAALTALARLTPETAADFLRKSWTDKTKFNYDGWLYQMTQSRNPQVASFGRQLEAEHKAWEKQTNDALAAQKKAESEAAAQAHREQIAADHALTPDHIVQWLESADRARLKDAFKALPQAQLSPDQLDRVDKALCAMAAKSDDKFNSHEAARLLADFGKPGDVDQLLALAANPDPDSLKSFAPTAIASAMLLDPAKSIAAIDAHSSEKRFAENVATELGRHGAKAEAAALVMLGSPNQDTRRAALNLLGRVGTSQSLAAIKTAQAAETDKKMQGHYKTTINQIERR